MIEQKDQNLQNPYRPRIIKINYLGMIFVALLVLAVILGGLWVAKYFGLLTPPASQSNQVVQDAMSGWKAYRNEEYGFEVKYPDYWFFCPNEKLNRVGKTILILKDKDCNYQGFGNENLNYIILMELPSLYIRYPTFNDLKTKLLSLVNSKEPYFYDAKFEVDSVDFISIDNLPAIKVSSCQAIQCGDEDFDYFIYNQNKLFEITYASSYPVTIHKEFDQILSTFKFIE